MTSDRDTADRETSDREAHLVELVDEAGKPIGARTVDEAHQLPGLLHRAFSVFLVDPAGRVLLQQRAATKTRFPLRWANSCCGHPAPGQSLDTAAGRRLHEELGVSGVPLTEIGVYLYRAEDPETGRVEFEYDHVLRGDFAPDRSVLPDPDEVADLRWMHPDELRAQLDADPTAYAPWLGGVLSRLRHPEAVPPAPEPAPPAAVPPAAGPSATPSRKPGNDGRWHIRSATGSEEDNPAERSGGR
ncbi:isopentenyl-diphosphate Delta-isomerase [Plantactinospora soyae]|uniref:Isopentenyl-diphosphate Delta-isomerase n=1 Tax=Plantactinospora soyae TaxID=1544732 RepID=A0A927QWR1_9ACTN|nr:isopentenyl-diphosphate Delta-isomerase [Plantactinospora soyae]MBE1485852.1 isopentenyl-diphosphate delta-isomerase [Plantactinospora soyae]